MMKKSLKSVAIGVSVALSLGLLVGCGGEKKAEKKASVMIHLRP